MKPNTIPSFTKPLTSKHNEPPIYSSYLGEGKLKGWKKRYFIQEASKLYYFYSDSNANDLSAALGFIDLSLASDIFVVNESCFDLVTPGR